MRKTEIAWLYFESIGAVPKDRKKGEWCLHHKDPTLKYRDLNRYKEWRIEDLQPMLMSEHSRYHKSFTKNHKGKHWYNNGVEEKYGFETPEGWINGRLPGCFKKK